METIADRSRFHAFEQSGWNSAAGGYADAFSRLTVQAAPALLDEANVVNGTRLLDLASGPGDLCALAAERGANATGLDFSTEMVALARERHPGIEFREGDAQALPFEATSFAAVTMSFLLGHLSYPERALAEAFRVIEPGGRLALAWWAPFDRAVGFSIILSAVRAHGLTEVGLPEGPAFDQFCDPEVCVAALRAVGFAEPQSRAVDMTWQVASGAELFESYWSGTVRTAGLLRAQTPEALADIWEAVTAAAAPYERDGAIELPMPAWVVSARR